MPTHGHAVLGNSCAVPTNFAVAAAVRTLRKALHADAEQIAAQENDQRLKLIVAQIFVTVHHTDAYSLGGFSGLPASQK